MSLTLRQKRIQELKAELKVLEQEEYDEIMAQTNGSLTQQCHALVSARQKVEAIKHYRSVTVCS